MRTILTIVLLFTGLLVSGINSAMAQCAMCRISLENNVSNGEIGISGNLNLGILYLFALPYVLVGVIVLLWYRKSKENKQLGSNIQR